MIATILSESEVKSTSSVLEVLKNSSSVSVLENVTKTMDIINAFLKFILDSLVSDGKIKIGVFDIPKVWKNAKILLQEIITLYPDKDIYKRLAIIPYGIGDVLIDYVLWCFKNIVTSDNKIKIGVFDIIPFIVKTIKFVKDLTATFKHKGLI